MAQGDWLITAELARLELDESEADILGREAERMLSYFETMARADVMNLEPTTHAFIRENRTREDRTEPFGDAEVFLEASPEREDDFFLIPNVL